MIDTITCSTSNALCVAFVLHRILTERGKINKQCIVIWTHLYWKSSFYIALYWKKQFTFSCVDLLPFSFSYLVCNRQFIYLWFSLIKVLICGLWFWYFRGIIFWGFIWKIQQYFFVWFMLFSVLRLPGIIYLHNPCRHVPLFPLRNKSVSITE